MTFAHRSMCVSSETPSRRTPIICASDPSVIRNGRRGKRSSAVRDALRSAGSGRVALAQSRDQPHPGMQRGSAKVMFVVNGSLPALDAGKTSLSIEVEDRINRYRRYFNCINGFFDNHELWPPSSGGEAVPMPGYFCGTAR